jgi:hypothetical protein
MDTVLCIRWLTDRPQANVAPVNNLAIQWHRCTPMETSQEELARLMGISERADPRPNTEYLSFSVPIF